MNKTIAEAKAFIAEVDANVTERATFGVGTSFIALQPSIEAASNLVIAAQNCHFEDNGAYTGEVSVPMLVEIGVTHCIIGHSERREMFNESDATVAKKANKLIAAGITPIVCIGETEAQFDANETETVIRTQLSGSLAGIPADKMADVVIAYEPIWAIGTGKSATKEIAQNCCAIVRDQVKVMYGDDVASKVRVQYGGSVKPENIVEYMAMEDIDGALIGGASLQAASFNEIIAKV